MVWKPTKTLGLVVGLVVALSVVGVDIFLVARMLDGGFDLSSYFAGLLFVLSLPLLTLLGYWYYGLLTLHYYLDRNALVIRCGVFSQVVPLGSIRRVVSGNEATVSRGFRGVSWAGYLKGQMRLRGLGLVLVYSSQPLERQLVVATGSRCYGISPRDRQRFLEALEAHCALGPTRVLEQTIEYRPVATLPIWRDRWFWIVVGLAFVANAALFGLVAGLYEALPARMPLRFHEYGEVGRIVPKAGLVLIPGIGALSIAANSVLGLAFHRHERLAAYLLAAVSLAIQPVLWWAVAGVVGL